MKEIVEGLRGPALGMVIVLIGLAATIVMAAFAALFAQMGLLLRLRSRDSHLRTTDTTGFRNPVSGQPASPASYASPKESVSESSGSEVIEGNWWPV